jgi:hypothetical protein
MLGEPGGIKRAGRQPSHIGQRRIQAGTLLGSAKRINISEPSHTANIPIIPL